MHIEEMVGGTVINLNGKALYIFGFFAIWLDETIGDNFWR